MKVEKIAEGAYFVPSYSEQTIAWSPHGFTIQALACEEEIGESKFEGEEEGPFTKEDFEQTLKR